jgi:phosphoserine phosphatase
MKKQYAVFDIDGVVTRTSLLLLTVRELIARGKLDVGPGREIELMLHDFSQRVSGQDYGDYMSKVVDRLFASMPNGLRVDEYDEVIDAVVKSALQNTYVYTRELIATLKRNNFFLIAISGAELRPVSTLSRALGFDAWVGEATFQTDDKGKLNGQVLTLKQTKAQILQTIIQKFGLETKGSTAVGDTTGDIDVLAMVESPIVFNPNQDLFKTARDKGWMIIIERKDMVYGMVKEGDQYVLKQVNA